LLKQYQQSLAESERLRADAEDGLRQYREAFESSQNHVAALADNLRQQQARSEQAQNHAMVLEKERDQARQQVWDLVNSTSWKITRPLRFLVRLLRSSPQLMRRAINVLRRPSAWGRLIKILRRGGLSAIAERAKQEL